MEAGIVPGDHSPSFATPVGRLGIAICYDFDYAACTWQAVHNGAELLAVPTYDAAGWSDLQHTQHARIAQTRAAEAGRWVLRATSSGVSQVITSRGEIAALLPNHVSGTVRAQVYPLTQRTLYIRLCYLLPYACVALSCLVLLLLLVNGIRKPRVGVD
jgi:apolipoprotein N-acyltransferase